MGGTLTDTVSLAADFRLLDSARLPVFLASATNGIGQFVGTVERLRA